MDAPNAKNKKRKVIIRFWDEKCSDDDISEYLDELMGRLEKDVSKRFKEITSRDISQMSFKKPQELNELRLSDEEFMLQCSFFMINKGKGSDSVIDKLKIYIAALDSANIANIANSNSRARSIISALKSHAAKKRWKVDPKSEQKSYVRELWKEWQKKPERYKLNCV